MPIYDLPITRAELRPIPKVSLNERHKYVKDSAFQTSFTGRLTDKAIHQYSLQGRYGSEAQKRAEIVEVKTSALRKAKNVKKSVETQLANKYANI